MYLTLFKTFFKIGMVTFGGGYAMISMIEEDVVRKYQWVDKEEFLDLLAIAQSCPGVFAINISTFIGYKIRKTRGAVCTALGTALPSFIIILLIPRQPYHCRYVCRYSAGRGGLDSRSHLFFGQECARQ